MTWRITDIVFMCVLHAATTATTIDDSSSTDDSIAAMQNEFKRNFLSLLDMSESPSRHPPRECVPEFMSDLQAHSGDVKALFSTFEDDSQMVCFNLTSVSVHDPNTRAKLKLFHRRHKNQASKNFTVIVDVNKKEVARRSFDVTSSGNDDWLTLNIRKIVKRYVRNSKKSICFDIKANRPHDVGVTIKSADCSHRPFLVLYLSDPSTERNRLRRTAAAAPIINPVNTTATPTINPAHTTATPTINPVHRTAIVSDDENRNASDAYPPPCRHCRRITLNITLDGPTGLGEVGFDWILFPRKFDVGLCRGECEHPRCWSTTHATFQALMHRHFPATAPKVLCSPAAFAHMTVLYFPQPDVVMFKSLSDAVVTRCGCR